MQIACVYSLELCVLKHKARGMIDADACFVWLEWIHVYRLCSFSRVDAVGHYHSKAIAFTPLLYSCLLVLWTFCALPCELVNVFAVQRHLLLAHVVLYCTVWLHFVSLFYYRWWRWWWWKHVTSILRIRSIKLIYFNSYSWEIKKLRK